MFNSIYVGLLTTELPCTFLDVKADDKLVSTLMMGMVVHYWRLPVVDSCE